MLDSPQDAAQHSSMMDLDLPNWAPDDEHHVDEGHLFFAGSQQHDFSDIFGHTGDEHLPHEPLLFDETAGGGAEKALRRAEAARVARQRRIALRRDKAVDRAVDPPAPVELGAKEEARTGALSFLPLGRCEVEAPKAQPRTQPSADQDEWGRKVVELEKELRSTAMKGAFLTKTNSALALKLEAVEARAVTLERENARLRRTQELFLVDGAGI